MAGLDKPIVVILDDIDRLETSEIRDVFKLVRLTASFPNILYLMAFDRVARTRKLWPSRACPAATTWRRSSRSPSTFLPFPRQALNRQVFSAIDAVLAGIDTPGHFDEQAWPDVYVEIIGPLIRNMRCTTIRRRSSRDSAGTGRTGGLGRRFGA